MQTFRELLAQFLIILSVPKTGYNVLCFVGSSSSNNTDVTCIDSNCEDEYVTCDEEDDFMKNLPPFQGCPCMLETYYHLASIRSDR
uniref:GK20493 n=1 Tax=Drosophila willistoni TaxID=7260 RepID=B4N524_DROWI